MWSSFWKEVTVPLPSQLISTGDYTSNNRSVGGRQKDAAAAASRGRHVEASGSEPAADYTTILRGVIVGEEQSGKTSLIRRLRGEDPFQKNSLDNERAAKNTNRRSNGNLMALVPWKIPRAASFRQKNSHAGSIDVVQLYVSEGNGFCYSRKDASFQKQWISVLQSQRGKDIDFIVWMIDPRMDKVLDFLREGLDALIPARARETDGQGDKERSEIIKHTLVQNICILVNFRDSVRQYNGDQASLVCQIQLVIEDVLSSHREYCEKNRHSCMDDTSTPTILVYETSMKDCYGLSNLLSFINLPYLSRKEREFQRLAEHAKKKHSQWKQEMMANKGIEYDEFIEQRLAQQKQSPILSTKPNKLEEEKEQQRNQLRQQSQLLQSEKKIQGGACASVKNKQRDEDGAAPAIETSLRQDDAQATMNDAEKRTIFVKSVLSSKERKNLINSGVPKDISLDAFFSDDDEDGQLGTNDSSDDSEGEDSDDGDFYIDVTGTRCANVNATGREHTKKSSSNRLHTDNKNEVVTAGERSNHLDEKNEIMAYSSEEESVDVVLSALQSPRITESEDVEVNNEKSAISNYAINVVEEEADAGARGSMNDDTSKSNTCSRTVDIVTSSDGIRAEYEEATEDPEKATKSEPLKRSPSFDDHDNHSKHDGVSIDETTSTNARRKHENIEKTSDQIVSSESIDEPVESGAVTISANEGAHKREEDSDNDSSFQIAYSQSKNDYPEEFSDRVNRKDRVDREDTETHIKYVQIDDRGHELLPTKEKSHLVLDSDEEGSMEGKKACDTKSKRETESAGCDSEFTRDATHLPRQLRPATTTRPNQMNAPAKSVTVSTAARAAIEAARVEAERMIALSQSNDLPTVKREKKSKKNKDGKKKKKKEMRHDSRA